MKRPIARSGQSSWAGVDASRAVARVVTAALLTSGCLGGANAGQSPSGHAAETSIPRPAACDDLPPVPEACATRSTSAKVLRVLAPNRLEVEVLGDPARVRLAGVVPPRDAARAARAARVVERLRRETLRRTGELTMYCPAWQTGREPAMIFAVGAASINEELVRSGLVDLDADDEGLSPELVCRLTRARRGMIRPSGDLEEASMKAGALRAESADVFGDGKSGRPAETEG